jgi:hypothetical protein
MKGDMRLGGIARILGILVVLALVLGLLLPLTAGAQEEDEGRTKIALAEVPTTGARRPGPIFLNGTRIRLPDGFAPVELVVDRIGLSAPVEVGFIDEGVMRDPSGPWVVSWYQPLGKVGEGGNVVMAGHVDYWDVGPAIFQGVPSLAPGDVIRVVGENGETYEYAVEWAQLFDVATQLTPEVIQRDIVGDTGQESLTLITCGGAFDGAEYLSRFVVRANKI